MPTFYQTLRLSIGFLAALTNFFSYIIFSKRRFNEYKAVYLYKMNCLSDMTAMLIMVLVVLFRSFYLDNKYRLICKSLTILSAFAPVSSWILAYISIDRMISVLFPKRYLFLEHKKFQLFICSLIFIINFSVFFVLIVNNYDLKANVYSEVFNNTIINRTETVCTILNVNNFVLVEIILTVNASSLPFIFMFISSIATIVSLFKTRRVIHQKQASKQKKLKYNKDIRFAITSISLNITFLIFTLPIQLPFLMQKINDIEYGVLNNIFFILNLVGNAINLLIYYVSNRIFRKELNQILKNLILYYKN